MIIDKDYIFLLSKMALERKKRYIQWKYQGKSPLEKLLERYPAKEWDWYWLSKNPNITWEIVQAHPDKPWKWGGLSSNEFLYNDTVYQRSLKKDVELNQERIRTLLYEDTDLCPDVIGKIVSYVSYD